MKKPISFILILCMVLAMMPMMSITASAAELPTQVSVGGTNVVSGADITYWKNDATGGITTGAISDYNVMYNGTTGVLTLNNAHITKSVVVGLNYSAIYANNDLTIVLSGTNDLESQCPEGDNQSYCVRVATGSLTITGSGRLTASSDAVTFFHSYGLYSQSSLTIEGGATVIAQAGGSSAVGGESAGVRCNGSLNVTNATLQAIGGPATSTGGVSAGLFSSYTVTITDSTVTATSADAKSNSLAIRGDHINIIGGNVTATCGRQENYMAYGMYGDTSINISSGASVTVKCNSDQTTTRSAMETAPNLDDYDCDYVITASTSSTGSSPVATYVPGDINTYRYFKIVPKSATPTASVTSAGKTAATQTSVSFALSNSPAYADSQAWKVYTAATGTSEAAGVTASNTGNALTLYHTSDVAEGTYYVAVTEDGKGESDRLALTVAGLPTISINDCSVTEGNSGTTTMTFTVRLDRTWASPITVDYATADNTAASTGSDYVSKTGTVTFASGTTTQAIEVTVNGDTLDEINENFYLYLSNASGGAVISDDQGIGTINDDDAPPTISINDASVSEGNSGTTLMTFTVSLSGASGKTVTVDFATADNTATVGSDYTAASGTLTFAPGETTKSFSVSVIGDTTPENDETFTVNLSYPDNATISDSQGTGTINNDDLAAEATPAAGKDYINEKLTGVSASAVYTVNGTDITADASGKITIENSWFGTTISLVKKGIGTTTTNSAVQSIALVARPATPTCTAIQPTASSATGTVSGISTTMQYSTGGGIWTNGTGSDISGIAPGTVLIRVKAVTGSAPASLIQTITITAYSAPPSGGGGGGGGSAPTIVTKIITGETVAGANVDKLVKEGKALTVEGKTGEKLVFDTAALKNIDGQTKDSVKVEIKDVSSDYKKEHPDRLVVSLSITAGSKHITSFGDGTATVSLPYELRTGEKAKDVTVWYLAEDGTMTEVPCTYDSTSKMATFKVNHFSLYVVGTADTSKWTNPFSDVKESSWFYDAVRYVSANQMMQGTDDKSFNPNGKTTRGMIVTILWRMENQPKAAKEITFTDVKDGRYYHDAVAWASEKGIVGGYSAEKFGPEDNITREQLAVILYKYAASKGYKTDAAADLSAFSDSGKIHSWSKDYLSWANGKGLITGTGSNLLNPLGAAERAQVAAILQRFVEGTVK